MIETENPNDGGRYSISKLTAAVEAVLFASGDPVALDGIAEITGMDHNTAKKLLDNMIISFENQERGIMIRQIGDSYQMCTRPCYSEYVAGLTFQRQRQALSQAALEVLSIIAYRQPVTKAVVEKVRGVSSDSAFERLLDRNLICESGKLDAPGRPKLYSTTEEFLRSFGLRGLGDLPDFADFEEAAGSEGDAEEEIMPEETEGAEKPEEAEATEKKEET